MFVSPVDWDVLEDFDGFAGPSVASKDCPSSAQHSLRANIRSGFHRSQLCLKDSAISLADQHLSPGKS